MARVVARSAPARRGCVIGNSGAFSHGSSTVLMIIGNGECSRHRSMPGQVSPACGTARRPGGLLLGAPAPEGEAAADLVDLARERDRRAR
jgi:hypothetical protein